MIRTTTLGLLLMTTALALGCVDPEIEDEVDDEDAEETAEVEAPIVANDLAYVTFAIQRPNTTLCMDVANRDLKQQACDSAATAQRFRTEDLGNGEVAIRNDASGQCLDVKDNSTAVHAQLQQNPCHYGDNQRFRIENATDALGGFRLVVKRSNMCVDVPDGSSSTGVVLQQYPCHWGPAQRFRISRDGNWTLAVQSMSLDVTDEGAEEPRLHAVTVDYLPGANKLLGASAGALLGNLEDIPRYSRVPINARLRLTGVSFPAGTVHAAAFVAYDHDSCGADRQASALAAIQKDLKAAIAAYFYSAAVTANYTSNSSSLSDLERTFADRLVSTHRTALDCSDDVIGAGVRIWVATGANGGLEPNHLFGTLDETWSGGVELKGGVGRYWLDFSLHY